MSSLSIRLKEEENAYHYTVLEEATPIVSLKGHYAFDNKLMAIQSWEGEVDREDVQLALLGRIHTDCKAHDREILIHLTPAKQPIYDAFIKGAFGLKYENLLFRTYFENLSPPSQEISLQSAADMPAQEYATLFHACNIGNPKEPQVLKETPTAFLERFIKEIADLYVPEQAFAARWEGQAVGVVHFRVTPGNGRVVGFMNYIGIHPDFRGRGLGTDLHRLGLQHLQAMGCTEYIGSTPETNLAMRQVFERNQVALYAKQVMLEAKS